MSDKDLEEFIKKYRAKEDDRWRIETEVVLTPRDIINGGYTSIASLHPITNTKVNFSGDITFNEKSMEQCFKEWLQEYTKQ